MNVNSSTPFAQTSRRLRAGGCLALALGSLANPAAALAEICDRATSEIFAEVATSVLRVFSVAIDPFSISERVQMAVGTGLVIDDAGHIVTNAHIVHESRELMVSSNGAEMLPATVIGIDPITDLAVIELALPFMPLQPAALGSSSDLSVGEEVLAIGFPFGIGKTATRGIVSAVERVVPLSPFSWRAPFIQTDAAINPGNSGGPLIDSCGRIIGINTLSTEIGQNLGFAVPIDLIRALTPELIETGRVSRAWHGINGRIVPIALAFALDIPPGFLVETVEPGSPAEEIGLRGGTFPVVIGGEEFLLGGDVLVTVNGEELMDMETVNRIASSLEVGDTIELEYLQDGFMESAEVVLPERPLLPGDVRRFRDQRSLH
jgi:S1-C subfamily serine protease